jgi:hypothetical protein
VRDAHSSLVSVRGPVSAATEARTEVQRRVESMRRPVPLPVPRSGACDGCGDAMELYRSGWCELCTLARRVALKGGPG